MTRLWERRLRAAIFLTVLAPAVALAQVYRWVDDEGRVHYSDTPPVGVEATLMPIESEPTDLEASLREQVERERELDLQQQLDADAAEDAAAEAARREALARACTRARARDETIETARRLSRVEDDGTRHTYNDEERAAALAEARRQVEEWCE